MARILLSARRNNPIKVTIDRFEGDYAVCEKPDRSMINIRKDRLPAGAKEGDVLIIEGDSIKMGFGETAQRKQEIQKLMDQLWK
jgi:hypothetical protein